MNSRIGTLLTLLLLLSQFGCKSPSSALQAANTPQPSLYAGTKIFGYSLNGVWTGVVNDSTGSAYAEIYSNGATKGCEIQLMYPGSQSWEYVSLYVSNILSAPGEYSLSSVQNPPAGASIEVYRPGDTVTYQSQSGILEITKFDTVNNLISGMFEFTGTTDHGQQGVVDSGYFNNVPIIEGEFGQGTVTATVDSATFGVSSNATVTAYFSDPSNQTFVINAYENYPDGSDKTIFLQIQSPAKGTTYNLEQPNSATFGYYRKHFAAQAGTWWSVQSFFSLGTVTITSFDTATRKISATFSFSGLQDSTSTINYIEKNDTLARTLNVSNGQVTNVQWYDRN